MRSVLPFVFLSLLWISVSAHTMLRCTKVASRADKIARPTYTCDGYPRNFRSDWGDVGFSRAYTYKILNPKTHNLDFPACSRGPQNIPSYDTLNSDAVDQTTPYIRSSAAFPMAHAKPGETVVLTWTPNGHKAGPGTGTTPYHTNWTIHWTNNPNSQILTRGDLLSGDFQLGPEKMYDVDCTSGPNNDKTDGRDSWPCYGNFTIPANTKAGVYQFVWWWVFNKQSAESVEEYTTCFDINVYTGTTPPPDPTPNNLPITAARTSAGARTSAATRNAAATSAAARTSAASRTSAPRTSNLDETESDSTTNEVSTNVLDTNDDTNVVDTNAEIVSISASLSVWLMLQLVAVFLLNM